MDIEWVRFYIWLTPLTTVFQVWLFLRILTKLKPEARVKLDLRFDLIDMVVAVLVLATVLACVRHFLLAVGLAAEDLVPIAIMLFPPTVVGMFSGRTNRKMISERARAMRMLAYLLGVLFPICAIPGLAATILMALNLSRLRNDVVAAFAWLFLLMPCLGYFWLVSIYRIRRDDKPVDGQL